MSLTLLPVELIDNICKYCEIREIKSLRLTSPSLCAVANEHLFPEVVLFLTRESLEACRGIAGNPVFAKTPTTLWLQTDRPRPLEYEVWSAESRRQIHMQSVTTPQVEPLLEELVRITRHDPTEADKERIYELNALIFRESEAQRKLDPSEDELLHHFEQYERLCEEADDMLSDNLVQSCLTQVFHLCHNLETVDLTSENCIRVSTIKQNKAFKRGLITPFGDSDRYVSGMDTMCEIVMAAFQAKFQPKKLRLGCVTHYFFNHTDISGPTSDFFSRLEELHWQAATPWLNDDGAIDEDELWTIADDLSEEHFLGVMSNTRHLEKLTLEMPCANLGSVRPNMSSLVGDITWPCLKTFSISAVCTQPNDFSQFLLRHSATLESVYLGEIVLLEEDWPMCFARFAGKLPNIKDIQLRDRFENEDGEVFAWFGHLDVERGNKFERQVVKYLMSGRGECPGQPDKMAHSDEYWETDDEDDNTES